VFNLKIKIMLVELENIELIEINGGCQACYDEGARWRRAFDTALLMLLFV
jgi:hypothetical protein